MSVLDRPSTPSSRALRARGLSCVYGAGEGAQHALRDVSFDVARGERLAILGESGAGKSTLLRCLNLLVAPTSGTVEIDGKELTSLDARDLAVARRQVGMIFQHFALLHRRTVRGNVAMPLELAGLPRPVVAARVDALLARVKLLDRADAYPAELSGGQRQRVGIARALACAPRVLLCDEPTSALDAETSKHVVALLDQLAVDLDLTIVFVTHQLELVRALADTVVVLEKGELQERTPVGEFFLRPRSRAGERLVAPESRMKLPDRLVNEARKRPGIGPSTLVTFPISSNEAPTLIFQTLAGHLGLRVDVVGADLESRRGRSVGALSVVIHGDTLMIRCAIAELEAKKITMEVVGHVVAA